MFIIIFSEFFIVKKMKIVFVQPKSCLFAEGHLWEPVSFGYLISYAKQFHPDNEYMVRSAKFYNDKEILEECENADLACFTATSPQIYHAGDLAQKIKAIKVFGGVHPTIDPEDTFSKGADIVVQGEGEIAFNKILNNPKKALKQRIFCEPFIQNLDLLPFPDREAIQQYRYLELTMQNDGMKIASIHSSRGCPYDCTFCTSKAIWGRHVRFRSAENVVSELEELVKDVGIEHLKFSDDTFTLKKQRVYEFCRLKNEQKLDVPWSANARVNNVDYDELKIMKESGCVELWFGVESGSQRVLDVLHKGITKEQIREAFQNSKKAGIRTRGYFMIGNETETREDITETENFIEELSPDIVGISINTPFPGSQRYKEKALQGIDWRKVDLYKDVEGEGKNVWGNEYLSGDELREIQHALVDKFKDKLVARFRTKDYNMEVKK